MLFRSSLIHDNDLMLGDLKKLSHWGLSGEGKLLLLDYGFSVNVHQTQYKGKMVVPLSSEEKPKQPEFEIPEEFEDLKKGMFRTPVSDIKTSVSTRPTIAPKKK